MNNCGNSAEITERIDMELTRRCQKLQEENELLKATVDRLEREKEEFEAVGKKLSGECEWWKNQYNDIEVEFARLRTQMDIVYLIFGGK